jgi:hypothetical protein
MAVNTYENCTINGERIRPQSKIDRCSPFGLPDHLALNFIKTDKKAPACEPPSIYYERKKPNWNFTADNTPKITCNNIESNGSECNEKSKVSSPIIGGKCETRMIPKTGGD